MDALRLEHHLLAPQGRGRVPAGAHVGAAGGAACGDEVAIALTLDGERVADAGFTATGCGTAQAAGSAAVALLRGRPLLDAARLRAADVAAELGGLSPGKLHAADLAADALHRALGAAAREQAALAPVPARTLVAMSGGVDSAVAALDCAREGEAVAVTLELWSDPENDGERSCCSAAAVRGARTLAHDLGLPHFTLDLRAEFRAGVVEPWIAAHAAGETPNPCVRCNGSVRLDAMLALARRLGAATLATGHYARTVAHDDPAGPLLRTAADPAKDQSYMLAGLDPASLARLRFPLGELTKPEVRARAAAAGLSVAGKPDSQDLCFLAGTGRERFLRRHGGLEDRAGDIVDADGRRLGRHRGAHGFTVGQRKGLGVAAAAPLYVTAKAGDRVVAGPRAELLTWSVAVRDARLHRAGGRVDRVKLRYRSRPVAARVAGDPGPGAHARLALTLAEPAERGAPGQVACLMDGEVVVGWGTIG
jgi:tRNA-specific 2-thiouridylase